MRKLQNSIPLKCISYILVPILVLNILINAFSISYSDGYQKDMTEKITYFETERFANNFLRNISNGIWKNINKNQNNDVIIEDNSSDDVSQEIINEEFAVKLDSQNTENSAFQKLKEDVEQIDYGYYNENEIYEYLIIDEKGKAYTNIEKTINTDTIKELKEYVKGKKYFWTYEGKEINTNIEKMKYENIAYNSYLERNRSL